MAGPQQSPTSEISRGRITTAAIVWAHCATAPTVVVWLRVVTLGVGIVPRHTGLGNCQESGRCFVDIQIQFWVG